MLELREWPLDAAVMNELYGRVDQSRCLVQMAVPLDETATAAYLQAVKEGMTNGRHFIVKGIYLDDCLIGKIEASRDETMEAELDIVIAASYCGRGYGRQAVQMFLNQLKQNAWCTRMCAYVDTGNITAGKMLAACGFSLGRFFKADVLVPYGGSYSISARKGCEMIFDL